MYIYIYIYIYIHIYIELARALLLGSYFLPLPIFHKHGASATRTRAHTLGADSTLASLHRWFIYKEHTTTHEKKKRSEGGLERASEGQETLCPPVLHNYAPSFCAILSFSTPW